MATPPGSQRTLLAESPADRALALSLAGEVDAALRWAAALVETEPARPLGLMLTARLLAAAGRREAAAEALEVAVTRAIDLGNLPLAVAASRDLGSLGRNPAAHLDDIAGTFCKGSARALAKGASPPALPRAAESFEPLPATLGGEALLGRAQQLVGEARQLLDRESAAASARPKVAPQPLFGALARADLRALLDVFEVKIVGAGTVLIEEGTTGAEAYVLARGELEVRRHTDHGEPLLLARLGAGSLFGEMALLSRAPRAASVVAVRPSIVLVARKDALDALAARQPGVAQVFADHCRRRMVENLVRTSSILSAVTPAERPALVERFVTRTFEEGEVLIHQGHASEGLHLIASGEVAVMHHDGEDTTLVARLGVGDVVGEVSLVLRRPSNADVIAACPTVTLHLPRERFLELIKEHPVVLAELYELAVRRDEETRSVVAQEAAAADEWVLV